MPNKKKKKKMEGILNAKDYNERRVFTMKKILKKLALIVLTFAMLLGSSSFPVKAATEGTVTATLREKSVYGGIYCKEAGKHLTVKILYKMRKSLTGVGYPYWDRADSFGNSTSAGKTVLEEKYQNMYYVKAYGYVDDVEKRTVEVSIYGTSTLEYWE